MRCRSAVIVSSIVVDSLADNVVRHRLDAEASVLFEIAAVNSLTSDVPLSGVPHNGSVENIVVLEFVLTCPH